jgi:predicted nuclease with TOPRIM domain
MQRTKSLHVDNVFRPHAASEMQLLRDKCQWYIRKYDESTRQAATLKTQLGVVDKEWDSKLQAMQDEFERLQKRNEVLEKENERLLGVIASLKKIPKRKPLPPKKVWSSDTRIDLGMCYLCGGEIVY